MTVSNNAFGELLGSIGASTTTMTIKDSKGGLFPATYPYKLTLEQLDTNNLVTKREIVTVTNKVADTFTITRASESCPLNDSATTQTQIAQSFTDGALVQLRLTADGINQIGTDITSLGTTKLDKTTYNAEKIAYASTSTGNDDYAITVSDIVVYNIGQTFKVKADVANTGSATLNVNGLGVKTLKKLNGGAFVDLDTNDIIANQIFWATYNGTDFQFSVDPANVTIPDIPATKSTFIAGENITAGNALYVPSIKITSQSNLTTYTYYGSSGNNVGQTFITPNLDGATSLKLEKFNFRSSGSGTSCTINVTLYSSVGGTLLGTSDTINISSSGGNWYTATFSGGINISPNTLYYIRINSLSGGNMCIGEYNGDIYSSGNLYSNGTSIPLKDLTFIIEYSNIGNYNLQYVYPTNTNNGTNFIGFATNTVSTLGNVIADTSGVSNTQTGLTIGSDYYLSNTPGAISTTPGTNVRRIGKSVSATAIQLETTPNDSLDGTTSTTATTGSVTLGNAVGYITVKINGVNRKIPYYS